MSSCNKISSEDVIPSAPPLYPSLPGDTGNFRLKRIRDYEKEPESEIDRCKQAAKELTLRPRSKPYSFTKDSSDAEERERFLKFRTRKEAMDFFGERRGELPRESKTV